LAGDKVTVSCAEGDTGFIYKGELKFEMLGTSLGHQMAPAWGSWDDSLYAMMGLSQSSMDVYC